MNNLLQAKEILLKWLMEFGPSILMVLFLLIGGHWVGKRLSRLTRAGLKKKSADPLLARFIGNCVYYVLMVAVLFAAAGEFGIDTTSFLAIAGSALLALGLAVKDNLSNFSSGILLVFMRPFTIGDRISVSGASGKVEKISMSTTILNTPDNKKVFIPNRKLLLESFTNETANPTRRVNMVVGISYEDDIQKAKEVILKTLQADPRMLADPPPYIVAAELADSSVNIYARPWVATKDYYRCRFDFVEAIKLALDANGVSIPFPQRDVRIVSETSPK